MRPGTSWKILGSFVFRTGLAQFNIKHRLAVGVLAEHK